MEIGFVVQSFIIYGILAISFYYLGKRYEIYNAICLETSLPNKNDRFLIAIAVIFALASGLRYLTGSDTVTYLKFYERLISDINYTDDHYETGWVLFSKLLIILGCNSAIYFGVIGFIQIYSLLIYFKYKPSIIPYISILIIISGEMLDLWNGLRQMTVAYLLFPLLVCIEDRKLLRYFFVLYLLSFIHKSALLLILFYPVFNYGKPLFKNFYIQLLVWILCIFIGNNGLWLSLMKYFDSISNLLGYNYETKEVITYMKSFDDVNFGIRSLIRYILIICSMCYSKKLFETNPDIRFYFFYNVFFIAICSDALFSGARIFLRAFFYTQPFIMVVYAFLLSYLFNSNIRDRIVGLSIIMLLILSLSVSIITAIGDGTALYKCVLWDKVEVIKFY